MTKEKRDTMMPKNLILDESTAAVLAELSKQRLPYYPVILCFATGGQIPTSCVPMPRKPEPAVGAPFDVKFVDILKRAYSENDAIHDGALIMTRPTRTQDYRVAGWSYRLIPAFQPEHADFNRGSAYNSAISMSEDGLVDFVSLLTRSETETYAAGKQVAF